MSIVEQLQTSATNVEEVRDGLGRLRGALEQTEAVLTVADDVLGRADDVLVGAADALESSKRWAPRAAVVLGVVAVATIGVVVVMRLRRRSQDDD
ncbi:MAG: hypothetical protein ACO3JT_00975 [Candidatus Nanopelagicales bacterium]|jgi:hypothetical protein